MQAERPITGGAWHAIADGLATAQTVPDAREVGALGARSASPPVCWLPTKRKTGGFAAQKPLRTAPGKPAARGPTGRQLDRTAASHAAQEQRHTRAASRAAMADDRVRVYARIRPQGTSREEFGDAAVRCLGENSVSVDDLEGPSTIH